VTVHLAICLLVIGYLDCAIGLSIGYLAIRYRALMSLSGY